MTQKNNEMKEIASCGSQCPVHGSLTIRGRSFEGTVIKKFPKRLTIMFERTVYVSKYERYIKARTRLHARLPSCMQDTVNIGDYIQISECRPLSKIIHFVVVKKIRDRESLGGEK